MDSRTVMGRPNPLGGQAVAYTGVAAKTSALGAGVTVVRIMSTTDCFVEISANSTGGTSAAANTSMYLPAFTPEYFMCPDNGFVSAIQVSVAGTLYVTPIV